MAKDEKYIGQLFNDCDLDGSGFIDQRELAAICTELSQGELADVFKELDKDGDGRISVAEFSDGFRSISQTLVSIGRKRRRLSNSMRSLGSSRDSLDPDRPDIIEEAFGGLTDGLAALSSQEQVVELYQQIHADYPQICPTFEKIILDVIRDIRFHQLENERLEQSYKREKEQHERHLRHLEEDIENQMQKVEARVKKEEREKYDQERADLKQVMELEMAELRTNLKKLQQLEVQSGGKEVSDEVFADLRRRMEDMQTENRLLKSEITDAQTNLALCRSELATLRQQHVDKDKELNSEKGTLMEYIKEQDNLTRQLHLLHDANKRLHDTNDDLRAALETTKSNLRRNKSDTPNRFVEERGSVVGAYLATSGSEGRPRSICSLPEDDSLAICDPALQRRSTRQKSFDKESLPEDFDSGNSTLRDLNEFDSEFDAQSFDGDRHSYRYMETETETEAPDSGDEMDTEVELELRRNFGRSTSRSPCNSRPHSVASSRGSQKSAKMRSGRRQLPAIPKGVSPKAVNQEPERMYKIVLAGDAAVGKSSFILRLCKGKFVNNLNSTLGVDFQTKTLEIDNRVIALQLWDTAGQERFRSIAKSYFRRADGVLLLYDCTYERSFLNVRDWVEAVEDGSQKKIPIMLVGNKTDLRDNYEAEGRKTVKTEDGQRLAKSFDALFIETSAKDGANIIDAVTDLARILRTNEDIEVQAAGLQLGITDAEKQAKKSPCCSM